MKESPEGVGPLCIGVTPGSISPEASSRWLGYGEAIMNARNNTYGE
ncbi:hypothetical protein QUH73_15140 [Labilibaculum sp. K2S]|nr:hypothetical protein [Labilibaculum sp. K2S]MDM8161159.1 hypothetical protein [Labilibaculum sp. K2S]